VKLAIVGMGVVGSAVAAASKKCTLITYDKYRTDRTKNWDQFQDSELCIVCVPTPTIQGQQRIDELKSALLEMGKYQGVVCIKSTVVPGTMAKLKEMFPHLRLVHNPEFLSERTAREDYELQEDALLSGSLKDTDVVLKYFQENLKQLNRTAVFQDYEVTEWAKYIHNCLLAVKLSFLNEMYDLCGSDALYKKAVEAAKIFGNVGSHYSVPGPDGKRGWGGMCFPKDMVALHGLAVDSLCLVPTLHGAIVTNYHHRRDEMEDKL
jgi:UDPglucose 6-dehydrogenase